jgi:putative ABC transport system ATP-binding protein
MITANNLTKSYWNQHTKEEIIVFRNLSFSIPEEKITVITGDSGTGKTTLIKLLSLRDSQFEGDINISGLMDRRNISSVPARCTVDRKIVVGALNHNIRARLRRECVGFIYQDYALIPELTILENVMLPLQLQKIKADRAREAAIECLNRVNLPDTQEGESGFHQKFPLQISGGQQQRVGIARAIVHKPVLLFADEPTGNLDDNLTGNIFELMKSYCQENKATLIIVTHDKSLATHADYLLHLEKPENSKPAMLISNQRS